VARVNSNRWVLLGIAATFLLAPGLASGQSVKVQVSSRSIEEGDAVKVAFIFEGGGEGDIPSLPDWEIMRRSESVSASFGMGRQTSSRTITVILQPKRTGKLSVGSATVVNAGAVLARSQAFHINVRAVKTYKPSEARKPGNFDQGDLVLMPEFRRDRYYVGEPIVVHYVLYASQVPGGLNVPEITVPDGVQREDVLQGRYAPDKQPKRLGGRQYRTITAFKEVWRVLRPDQVRIPQIKAEVRTSRRNGLTVIKAPPLVITVDAPPETGRPPEYRSGSIGEFSITASISEDQSGRRALLEVRIDGNGSLTTLEAPDVIDVTGAEVQSLPSDDMDLIEIDGDGMHGKRVFQYLLTPSRAGTVFVPAITFAFFNPKTARYQTVQTKPQNYVAKEAVASTRRSAVGSGDGEDTTELHPIESESELVTVSSTPLHQRAWFLVLLALPFLGFIGLEAREFASRRRQSTSGKVRERRAFRAAGKGLKSAEALVAGGKPMEVYGELARVVRAYTQDRFGFAVLGLTADQLREAFTSRGVAASTVDTVTTELEAYDFARFAPGAGEAGEARGAIERARAMLAELEKTA
jgi:hypothetical protein